MGCWELIQSYPRFENNHLSLREKFGEEKKKKLLPLLTGQEKCPVLYGVKAKSAFADTATVSVKLSWAELNSLGNVG